MAKVRVRDGESWEDIASRTLGNPSLGATLAGQNGAHPASAPVGEVDVADYDDTDADQPGESAPASGAQAAQNVVGHGPAFLRLNAAGDNITAAGCECGEEAPIPPDLKWTVTAAADGKVQIAPSLAWDGHFKTANPSAPIAVRT